jgi:biotin carboxyl carrier protein
MKLYAEINDQKHEITLKREAEKVFAEIDGRSYELEASEPEPNVFLLKHNNRIYQIYVAPNNTVSLGNNQFEINLIDPKRLRASGEAGGQTDGTSEIKTAMPGKVVRVLVEQGAEIQKGEGVIIVEAMKMQNEMKSPKDGIVKEIRFSEGATVNAGEVLAVIE